MTHRLLHAAASAIVRTSAASKAFSLVRTALLVAAVSAQLTTVAHARSLQDIKASGEISIVTTSSSPPHGFLDPKTNALSGIMFDLGNAIAKRIGVTAKFTEVPFSGLIPTLTSGRADAMAAPLFITPDRAKVVDFSVPVYGWGEGIVVNTKDHAHYPDFDALKGKKIGTLTDSVQYKMAQALTGTTVTAYPDYISLIADVRAGRIDLGIVDPPSVAYQIQSHNIATSQPRIGKWHWPYQRATTRYARRLMTRCEQ
jgi:polar amino acid transport system substrate-binding protein